jgi:hypothetical protein
VNLASATTESLLLSEERKRSRGCRWQAGGCAGRRASGCSARPNEGEETEARGSRRGGTSQSCGWSEGEAQEKVVRDSFTMPKSGYEEIAALRQSALTQVCR